MSETSAKSIRAAREAKAKRLGSAGDPKTKVDSSSWTPPEMMNTGAKTGLRPVSRRQFKRGGKVGMEAEGSCGAARACLLYTSPSPRDRQKSRMPSSA